MDVVNTTSGTILLVVEVVGVLALAAVVGASAYILLVWLGLSSNLGIWVAMGVIFAIPTAAIRHDWPIPKAGPAN